MLLVSNYLFSSRNPNPTTKAERDRFVCPFRLIALAGIVCYVMLLPMVLYAQTDIEGEVSGDWVPEGSPYRIIGETVITEDETLQIHPGVTVEYTEAGLIILNGQLIVEGAEDDSVYFTGDFPGTMITNRYEGESPADFRASYLSIKYRINGIYDDFIVDNSVIEKIQIQATGNIILRNNTLVVPWVYDDDLHLNYIEGECDSLLFEGNSLYFSMGFRNIDGLTVRNNSKPPSEIASQYSALSLGNCVNSRVLNNRVDRISSGGRNGTISNNQVNVLYAALDGGTIQNNHISWYIELNASQNIEILQNDIEKIRENCRDLLFANNIFRAQFGAAQINCEGSRFFNNTFLDHNVLAYRGRVGFHDFHGAILRNNIFYNHDHGGVAFERPVDSDYNCFFGFDSLYAEGGEPGEHDILIDPLLVGGNPFACDLLFGSPCIDAGDPELGPDPDGSLKDIGARFFDQRIDHDPVVISPWIQYCGSGRDFTYVVRAVDDGEITEISYQGLPDWLNVTEENPEDGWSVISGNAPEDQEDFEFTVIATDENDNDGTMNIIIPCRDATFLKGSLSGVLEPEGNPYVIEQDIRVEQGESLTLEAGVELGYLIPLPYIFVSGLEFNVLGQIKILGNQENRVRFYQDDNSYLREDEEYCGGMRFFIHTQDSCFINGADIGGAAILGINADYLEMTHDRIISMDVISFTKVKIENCDFENCYVDCDSLEFTDNYIHDSYLSSIFEVDYGIIRDNHFVNIGWGHRGGGGSWAFYMEASGEVIVDHNLFYNNADNLFIDRCANVTLSRNTFQRGITLYRIESLDVSNNMFTGQLGHVGTRDVGEASFTNNLYELDEEYELTEMPEGFGILSDVNENGDSTDVYNNLFQNPEVIKFGPRPFSPSQFSPAIDAGSEELPPDPDASNADIGFWSFDHSNRQLSIMDVWPRDDRNPHNRDSIFVETQPERWLWFGVQGWDDGEKIFHRLVTNGIANSENVHDIRERYFSAEDSLYFTEDGYHEVEMQLTDGNSLIQVRWLVQVGNPNSVEDETSPDRFQLISAYPNPFNDVVTLNCNVNKPTDLKVKVFDVNGRLVYDTIRSIQTPGVYLLPISGNNWASGSHFLFLENGDVSISRQLTLIK